MLRKLLAFPMLEAPTIITLPYGMRDPALHVNSEPWWNPLGRGLALATLPSLKVLNHLACLT